MKSALPQINRQRGAAVVEFALVLPIFLLVVFASVEFGVVMYDQSVITNASREAARAGIVLQDPKLTVAQIQAVATTYISTNLITFASSKPSPSIAVVGAQGAFGAPLTVTITYSFTDLGLGVVNLFGVSNLDPMHSTGGTLGLTASTTMKNE